MCATGAGDHALHAVLHVTLHAALYAAVYSEAVEGELHLREVLE